MVKMDPGKGDIRGESLEALGAGAVTGAAAGTVAMEGDALTAPPVETSTV